MISQGKKGKSQSFNVVVHLSFSTFLYPTLDLTLTPFPQRRCSKIILPSDQKAIDEWAVSVTVTPRILALQPDLSSINFHPKINAKLEGYSMERKKGPLGLVLGPTHSAAVDFSFLSPIILGLLPG